MAKCTNITTLKYHEKSGSNTTFTKLIDITEYPDLGGENEQLDATTLSDTKKRYINGIQDASGLTFSAWYTKEDYKKITALKGKMCVWHLEFGDDGADGIFEWEGQIDAYPTAGSTNEVRSMRFSISDEGEVPLHLVES